MTRYVAFLRGINVGGHKIVKKEKLQEAFTALGLMDVSTFKQSGNVIFETDTKDAEVIRRAIEQKLSQLMGSDVGVFLRTISQLEEIIKNNPFPNAEEGASFLVTFMRDKQPNSTVRVAIPKSTAEIIQTKDFEAYSITRGHGDGAKPNPYIEAKFKTQATTRNLNTIKEKIQLNPA
jgi:uncharacterized protein (DUF1697 family)